MGSSSIRISAIHNPIPLNPYLESAIDNFTTVISLIAKRSCPDLDQLTRSLVERGGIYAIIGQNDLAIKDLETAVILLGGPQTLKPNKQSMKIVVLLQELYKQKKCYNDAIQYSDIEISLKSQL